MIPRRFPTRCWNRGGIGLGRLSTFPSRKSTAICRAGSHDSRKALVWTSPGIGLIVYLCFRNIRVALLVLAPISSRSLSPLGCCGIAGHSFSFMSITAIPLLSASESTTVSTLSGVIGKMQQSILVIAKASGAALIQSNLTTIVGFGALMASTFAPLAEMGLVTSMGVALPWPPPLDDARRDPSGEGKRKGRPEPPFESALEFSWRNRSSPATHSRPTYVP